MAQYEECSSLYQEELGGSLGGTEITYDKPEEDTRRGALAVQAGSDDELAIELAGTIIEDRPIDRAARARIKHASQLADQYAAEERVEDEDGAPIPPPPPKRTFEHSADGIRDAWTSVMRARTQDECSQQWDILCSEFSDQPGNL